MIKKETKKIPLLPRGEFDEGEFFKWQKNRSQVICHNREKVRKKRKYLFSKIDTRAEKHLMPR